MAGSTEISRAQLDVEWLALVGYRLNVRVSYPRNPAPIRTVSYRPMYDKQVFSDALRP
jgi:hypothetical protein